MKHTDFYDWKASSTKQLYADSFAEFKWKFGVNWQISRRSLCSRETFDDSTHCDAYYVDAMFFRRLSQSYGPPKAYKERRSIPLSKLQSVMSYLNNCKIPGKNLAFFLNLPVEGDTKKIADLKLAMRAKFNTENVI